MSDLYTLDDLVEKYGTPKDTLYDLLKSGELVGFKVGKTWRVHPDDWEAFIAKRRKAAATAARKAAAAKKRAARESLGEQVPE